MTPDPATRAWEIVRVVPRRENVSDAMWNVYVGDVYIGTMPRENAEERAARISAAIAAALADHHCRSCDSHACEDAQRGDAPWMT